MGTPDFSLKSLTALYEAKFNVVGVYTRAPKPSGRNYKMQKSVVHQFAEEKNIPVYHPKNFKSQEEVEIFRALNPDLAIVSSYGIIITQDVLDIPKYGFINIHASLLPRWRGASPVQSSILAGDKKTGITIMKMDAGIDTGDIISMKAVDIFPETSCGELMDKLGDLGASMILETLDNFDDSLSKSRKQPENNATYAQKVTKDLSRIDWNKPAEDVLRQIKAFSPDPAAWAEVDGVRLKVFDAETTETSSHLNPGLIQKNMIAACRTGSLKLTSIQPSGKNKMSGEDFMRGRQNLIGAILK
jgi:methionyl-tRNA formyltransferase